MFLRSLASPHPAPIDPDPAPPDLRMPPSIEDFALRLFTALRPVPLLT